MEKVMDDMKQQLSAMMDGEIDLDANPHLLLAAMHSDEIANSWAEYHLIGDALRHEAMQVNVTARVMQQLASEPVVLAPRSRIKIILQPRYAAAASVVAVTLVGWMALHGDSASTQASVAQNMAKEPTTLNAEAFDHYLMAHAEFAPNNGLQRSRDVQLIAYTDPGN
ncbi:MAG: sigma-E factor negative regulatory protein [Methylophilaceae bacterium]